MPRLLTLPLLFCAFAVVAVHQLQVSPAERFDAEIRRLAPAEALDKLNAAGAVEASLGLMRADLARQSGDFETARAVLSAIRDDPDLNLEVHLRLAEIARIAGDIPAAARHLRAAFALEPTTGRRLTLGGWYRLLRDERAELEVLQAVPPTDLIASELERLLALLQRSARFDAYLAVVSAVAAGDSDLAATYRARTIDVLVDLDRTDQAVAVALAWHKNDPPSLLAAAERLIARGALREAMLLAQHALAGSPDLAGRMVLVLARSGHRAAARALRDQWLKTDASLGDEDWCLLLDLTAITGDLDGLRTVLRREAPGPDRAILAQALAQFVRFQGPRALIEHRALLAPSLLEEAPLIGAAWAAEQGRQRELQAHLIRAADHMKEGWERDAWLSLAQRLRGSPGYRVLLEGHPTESQAPTARDKTVTARTTRAGSPRAGCRADRTPGHRPRRE